MTCCLDAPQPTHTQAHALLHAAHSEGAHGPDLIRRFVLLRNSRRRRLTPAVTVDVLAEALRIEAAHAE